MSLRRLFQVSDVSEMKSAIEDLRALFALCALFLEHVDRNASVPTQRRILEQLLRRRPLTYDELWSLDAAVRNRIARHLRGGGLRMRG